MPYEDQGQRHNAQVEAFQAQGRWADEGAHQRGNDARSWQPDEER